MEENKNSYFGGIRDGLKSLATGLGVTLAVSGEQEDHPACIATPPRPSHHAAG